MKGLRVNNLHVSVDGKEVVKGVSLAIGPGEIHALMGPNGGGKSTLAYALMGHPRYRVETEGGRSGRGGESPIAIDGESLLEMRPDERARKGLLLAFQNPLAVPGVPAANLLRTAYQRLHGEKKKISVREFNKRLARGADRLSLERSLLERPVNEDFSGGEKKKVEMLQILSLEPRFVIFDEIDTGLDVDALKAVTEEINQLAKRDVGVLLITHSPRLLRYLKPDRVHVLMDGRIVKSGGSELALKIEKEGYGGLAG
jgi:Fe-S cluster assembly ATP-binding protein